MEQIYKKKSGNGNVVELCLEGRMTVEQLSFLVESVKKYKINKTTLNQEGNIVIWNMKEESLETFLLEAEEAGMRPKGAYSRKTCKVYYNALSGLSYGEAMDVRPYAETVRDWLESKGEAKAFSVYFSSLEELPEESQEFDMLFIACEGEVFRILVKSPEGKGFFQLAENTEAVRFLSYVKIAYEVKDAVTTEEEYRPAFWPKMGALSDEERHVEVTLPVYDKTGEGNFTCGPRVISQKQEELYAAEFHPLGGVVNVAFWSKMAKAVKEYKDIEFRIDRRENFYVCNLLAEEVHLPLDAMTEGAMVTGEKSVVRSWCGLCDNSHTDAQVFENVLLKELRKMNLATGALPTYTVCGCERASGWVPPTQLRFLAASPAEQAGKWFLVERFGDSQQPCRLGCIPQKRAVEYLIAIGALVQSAGTDFAAWDESHPGLLEKLTILYSKEENE